jgi:hypothetical protein
LESLQDFFESSFPDLYSVTRPNSKPAANRTKQLRCSVQALGLAGQSKRDLNAVPVTVRQGHAFPAQHHRHNLPTVGCKFTVAAVQEAKLVGVAVCGRPNPA